MPFTMYVAAPVPFCACLELFSNVELAIRPFGAMRCQSMPVAQQLALFCVDVDALNFSRILLIRCDAAVCLKLGADH
jgi:hypothetical protein